MNINPISQIKILTDYLSQKEPLKRWNDTSSKIDEISAILTGNPEIKENDKIMNRIFTFIAKSRQNEIRNFGQKLLLDLYCVNENDIIKIDLPEFLYEKKISSAIREIPAKMGKFDVKSNTLYLSENALQHLSDDEVWSFIADNKVKRLFDDSGYEYNERVLKQLLELKPSIDSLAIQYFMVFTDGVLKVSKADLLLCGEYFHTLFDLEHPDTNTVINLSSTDQKSKIPFEAILNEVKTGNAQITKKENVDASNYFLYSRWVDVPKNAFGPKDWGDLKLKVFDTPSVPDVILNRVDPEKYLVVLIPANVTVNTLVKKIHEIEKIEYLRFDDDLKDSLGGMSAKNSYWIAIRKQLILESRGEDLHQNLLEMAEKMPLHCAPSILEVVAANLAHYKVSGESLLGEHEDEVPNYTSCIEDSVDKSMMIAIGGSDTTFQVYSAMSHNILGITSILKNELSEVEN